MSIGPNPMMQAMGGAPPMMRNPSVDYAQMMGGMQRSDQTYRRYPSWFRPPSEPSLTGVHRVGVQRYEEYMMWRKAVRHDLRMLNMLEAGIFRNDERDVENHVMEPYQSTALVDEFNLAVSWISGLQRRIEKEALSDDLKIMTRRVRLAAEWLNRTEMMCHTDRVEMVREVLEPKILLGYGKIVKRRTLDRFAEPYYSPYLTAYIDPTQVVHETDGPRGLKAVWRVHTAKVRDLVDAYGDLSDGQWRKIKDKYGNDLGDESEIPEVVEYWDRWYRCVSAAGMPIVPVTAHEYGDVPFVISLGPLGMPACAAIPSQTSATGTELGIWRDQLAQQSVGYARFRKIAHMQQEAVMTRQLYGLEQDIFPAIVRYRSMQAMNNPTPDLDGGPLAQNPAIMGEEKLEPFPRNTQAPLAHQHLMQQMERDRLTGSPSLSAFGHFDQANISGTANRQAHESGQHLWRPWVKHLESFQAMDTSLAFRLWGRLGHTVEYAQRNRRPFLVPVSYPQKGEESSFELDSDTLARVGPDVRVVLSAEDKDQWLMRAQTMQAMRQEGFTREWLVPRLFNEDYDPQMYEEWQEEQTFQQMLTHPRFLELVGIPVYLVKELDESRDDPVASMLLQTFLERWTMLMVEPAMLEHQLKMLQLQQQLATPTPAEAVPIGGSPAGGGPTPGGGAPPPAGGPSMSPPPGSPPSGQLPPTTSGLSLPDFNRGPGSRTGSQSPGAPVGPQARPQGGY